MALDAIAGSGPLRETQGERRQRSVSKAVATVGAASSPARQSAIDPRPADDRSDADLIERMARGERDAHRLLYERHALALLRYLVGRLGGNRALAEEVLQEVMIVAWQGAAGFRGQSRVRTWLFGIAHHRAANLVRRRRREVLSADPTRAGWAGRAGAAEPANGGGYGAVDRRLDLERGLRVLPEAQRAALELVFYHGLTVAEAAEVLEVAPGTVKSRLFRAKESLRAQLSSEEGSDHA